MSENFRLGKQPKKHDRRNLQFARYLPKLPAPPSAIDRASRMPKNIGMMANDQYGDCTIAAAGHMVQSWSTYADRGTQTIPDSEIVSAYLAISPYDQGAYMLDALNYWRKTGVGGDKIEAYVEVARADLMQAKLAIQLFGAVYIGMALPDENTFGPWLTPTGPGNPYNGHAVCLIAYDDNKEMFKVCTWGQIWDMSYAWYQRYADECYAALNDLSINVKSGTSPSGFNYTQLAEDLNHLGDPIVEPVVPPPPPPTPDPDPVSPPEPVPTPDPVDPTPVQPVVQITGIDYAYWEVYMNDAFVSKHEQQFEAAEKAVNLALKYKSANVYIAHIASYAVTAK